MDQIDRELTALLSLEPSPEFRAKVRARVAGERMERGWHLPWRLAVAGAAALAVVGGVALRRVVPAPPVRPTVAAVERVPAAPAFAVDSPPATPPRVAAVAARRSAPRTRATEVVIDARAVRGLQQLDALVREGRTQFVFEDKLVVQDRVTEIVVPPIAPIDIVPIDVATGAEGVGDSEGDAQ